MSWLNFFKKRKKQVGLRNKEASGEVGNLARKGKAELQHVKNIRLEELNSMIEREERVIEHENRRIRERIRKDISDFGSGLRERVEILKKINLEERKEQERIKLIVRENLNLYVSHLGKLIKELRDNEEPDLVRYITKIRKIFEVFRKSSDLNFEKSTILIGRELEETRKMIKRFLDSFDVIVSENEEIFERARVINELNALIHEFKGIKSACSEIRDSIRNSEQNCGEIKRKKKANEEKLESLRNSHEYKDILKERERIGKATQRLNLELTNLKREIDIKSLLRDFHDDKRKSRIIRSYSENFLDALEADKDLEFFRILKERQGYENLIKRISEIKMKNRDIMKGQREYMIENRLKVLEDENKRLNFESLNLENDILKEKRKMERFKEKHDKVVFDINNKAGFLWKNVRLSEHWSLWLDELD